MLKRLALSFLIAIFAPILAHAQVTQPGVQRHGAVTSGHCVSWFNNQFVQDSGGVCGGGGGGSPGGSTGDIQWNNAGAFAGGRATYLTSTNFRLGGVDVATPAAQTFSVPSVVGGTLNGAGANVTIDGSASTGNGIGGSIFFDTSVHGGSGTTQNGFGHRLEVAEGNTGVFLYDIGGTQKELQWFPQGNDLIFSSSATIDFSPNDPVSGIDTTIGRAGAANLRLGAADAAAPVAQTLGVQNVVAGTTNTAGANWTINGSQGTGTGAGGSVIFQAAPAGSTGSTQNSLIPELTINSTKGGNSTGDVNVGSASHNATVFGIVSGSGIPSIRYIANSAFINLQSAGTVAVPAFGFSTTAGVAADTFITRKGAANLQLGAADAAAPIAQTLGVQSVVAGTTDTAGANWTLKGSAGTGAGAPGNIIFQGAKAGSSGSTQNAYNDAVVICPASNNTLSLFSNGATTYGGMKQNGFDLVFFSEQTQCGDTGSTTKDVMAVELVGGNGAVALRNSAGYGWSNAGDPTAGLDTVITRKAAATIQLGSADAAAPTAQTLGVQSVVAGTANTAGANWTLNGSQGTGTGAGGKIIFQTAPAGSTGSAQNALATTFSINPDGTIQGAVKTVATLPTCNAGEKGARSFVSDANANTFHTTAAGGGTNNMAVICDGTNWYLD